MLLFGEHGAVKGKQFNPGRSIGSIADRIRLLANRDIDELIILDIEATPNRRSPRFEQIAQLTKDCFFPVTVGGGVRTINDVGRLLASGADKVSIGTHNNNPHLIEGAAKKYGSQAIVISIDHGKAYDAVDVARRSESLGAGEILLNDISRDGMMAGMNLPLIEAVSSAVNIPVIACGGCGSYADMEAAINAGAHAVAVGAAFQFLEITPKGAARYLDGRGIQARI